MVEGNHHGAVTHPLAIRDRSDSSVTYKGQAVDVKQVGRELECALRLEGSVRKAETGVRITAQ